MKKRNVAIFVVFILSALAIGCGKFKEFDTSESDNMLIITKYTGDKKDVIIPEKKGNKEIIGIDSMAFMGNEKIETIFVPDSVTSIGNNVFSGCSSLKNINFSKNLSKIGDEAFKNCRSLVSVELPAAIKEIGRYAFNGCTNLEHVSLPASDVKFVDIENIFGNCPNITNVTGNEELVSVLQKEIQKRENARLEEEKRLYREKKLSEYNSIKNPTINQKFMVFKELYPDSYNYSMTVYFIDGYKPLNANALPVPPVGIAENPKGKLLFISNYSYDGYSENNGNVISGEYVMNFEMLRGFEERLTQDLFERYVLRDLSEVEYIIFVTHRQGQKLYYYTTGIKTNSFSIYETNALVDLYKLNSSRDSFVKVKNLGTAYSGHKESYSIKVSGNVFIGTSMSKILDVVMMNLKEIGRY